MKTITKFLIGYILLISILFGMICPINAEPTYIKGSAIKPNTFYDYASGLSAEILLDQINPLALPDDSTAWGYKTATGYGYYASSSSSGATVECVLNLEYTARSQGDAASGYYRIFDYDATSSIIISGTVGVTQNGLLQYETTHYALSTWDDSGTDKLRVTMTYDVDETSDVRVSYYETLPLMAVIQSTNVLTTDGYLQDDLDDRYTKAEANAVTSEEVLVHNESSSAHSNRFDTLETQVTKINPATIGNSKYYGTNSGGTSGYYDFPAASQDLVKIETITRTNDASTLTFSTGFSTDYNSYKVVALFGCSDADTLLRFNGDTGNNYSNNGVYTSGSTVGASINTNEAQMKIGKDSREYNAIEITISNITTTYHGVLFNAIGVDSGTGAGYSTTGGGVWKSTNAISSITIFNGGANFTGTFTLYGIK